MKNEPVEATMLVIHALDDLGVPYVIGGSLASAVHGVMRATMDTETSSLKNGRIQANRLNRC